MYVNVYNNIYIGHILDPVINDDCGLRSFWVMPLLWLQFPTDPQLLTPHAKSLPRLRGEKLMSLAAIKEGTSAELVSSPAPPGDETTAELDQRAKF